jgi:hypothetical protein
LNVENLKKHSWKIISFISLLTLDVASLRKERERWLAENNENTRAVLSVGRIASEMIKGKCR